MKKDAEELLLDAVIDVRNKTLDEVLNLISTGIAYREKEVDNDSLGASLRRLYEEQIPLLRDIYDTVNDLKWEGEKKN